MGDAVKLPPALADADNQDALMRLERHFASNPGPEGFGQSDRDVGTVLRLLKATQATLHAKRDAEREAAAAAYERCAERLGTEATCAGTEWAVAWAALFRRWAAEARGECQGCRFDRIGEFGSCPPHTCGKARGQENKS